MRCKAQVPQRPHYVRYHQCSREATKNSDYCTQHMKKNRLKRASAVLISTALEGEGK